MAEQNAAADGKGNTGTAAGAGGADGKGAGTPAGTEGKETPAGDGKAGETQAGDGKGGDGQNGKGGKEGEQPKAPEKYDLKLPDGAADYLDATDVKQIETIAKEQGWTNEQAQSALDRHADALATQSTAWREATEKDPTYGGDNLAETQRTAQLALDKLRPANTPAGKAFRQILTKTGYGNRLEIVSFLSDLGKLMAEDSVGAGAGAGKTGGKDAASVLYGETK